MTRRDTVTPEWVLATPKPGRHLAGATRGGISVRQREAGLCGTIRIMRRIVIAVVLATMLTGCGGSSQGPKTLDTLHRESFEAIVGAWPLTVGEATPVCGRTPGAIGIKAGSTIYALNGTAQSHEGWPPIDAIWADNPQVPGAKIPDGDLIEYVAARC